MKKIRSITAIILSAVMILCMFAVPAGAEKIFDNAIEIEPYEYYSLTLKNTNDEIYYKVNIPKPGTITIRYNSCGCDGFQHNFYVGVYDSDANLLYEGLLERWNGKTLSFNKAGTYYFHMKAGASNSYFKDLYYIYTPTPVTAIKVSTLPAKTKYELGEALDLTGGKLTLFYEDNTTEIIDLTPDMVSGFDSVTGGKKKLTVTYNECTASFDVTVKGAEPEVQSIYVSTAPAKTQYYIGETLDVSGGKITVKYTEGKADETIAITSDMCSGFDSTKPGEKNVTVTYEEKKATFTVTVKEPEPDPFEERGTVLEVGKDKTYRNITEVAAKINSDIRNGQADAAYTIEVSDDTTENKSLTLPAVTIIIKADDDVNVNVSTLTAKGDLLAENICFKSLKGGYTALKIKKSLTAGSCTFGKASFAGSAELIECTGSAITAKSSLTLEGGTYTSVKASGKRGTTTRLEDVVTITKDLKVSGDLVVEGESVVGGILLVGGSVYINGFTVKNG